jgi:phytoene desaturase
MDVVVVGSGIAGLASAIRMAVAGHKVKVYEASNGPGGKLSSFNLEGFRFDRGPSLFTMPALVEELFLLAGFNPKEYFDYFSLEESCRYFFADGKKLFASTNLSVLANSVEENLGLPKEKFIDHLNRSSFFYETLAPIFLDVSLHRTKHFTLSKTFRAVLNLHRLGLFRSMDGFNKKHLKNKNMEQFFNRYATYNGSNPFQAPATLHIIPHLEHNIGTFFPKGGMFSITKALHKLAADLGVEFFFNAKVEEILFENKMVSGINLEGKRIPANLVICNVDIYFAYKNLLKTLAAPQKLIQQPKSSSALVFYWGINKHFPELGLHNIVFSGDYKKEFDAIKEGKGVYVDPTIYINITSKHSPDDAPKGSENWFVMVNVPNHQGQNWMQIQQEVKKNVLRKLSLSLGENIESLIVQEAIWNPPEIESMTGSYAGALYGNSSNNKMAAFLRHPNFSKQMKGLYFCGGSVHPGGGIPLCLKGAAIVERCIKEDYPNE